MNAVVQIVTSTELKVKITLGGIHKLKIKQKLGSQARLGLYKCETGPQVGVGLCQDKNDPNVTSSGELRE